MWRALRVGLFLLAVWGVSGALNPGFSANGKNNSHPDNGKGTGNIVIRRPSIPSTPIQVNVDRVIVPVTVTDPYDRIVTGLDKDNFQVFDDKVRQKILSFSSEDAPIAVGMIFDTSGSMSDKIQKSKEAALQFFKTSNPEDQFMLVTFNNRPYLLSDLTSNYENLLDRLLFVKSGGRTS